MLTESLIRKKFVATTMAEGMDTIFSRQQQVAQMLGTQSGRLRQWARDRHYTTHITETSRSISVPLMPYVRFLDMQYRTRRDRIGKFLRKQLALYNRTVWGILYRQVFPQLRYGFTDEIRQQFREELEETFKNRK